jgi:dTMP kinase
MSREVAAPEPRGALIAFEGLDQSGKETQVRRLRTRLEDMGRRVRAIAFPDYATPIALEIERALAGEREYAPDVLQLLYIANRYEYRPRIESWMRDGTVVLCDRYVASSIAYGEAFGLDAAWLADVQRGLPAPTLTVLLDIAPETAAGRKASGRDRFERDLPLLARVRASYLRLATAPGWARVDGEQDRDAVGAEITRAVLEALAPR